MTARIQLRDTSPTGRNAPVRLELVRHGFRPQPLTATVIGLDTEGAEVRVSSRLGPGEHVWLAIELGDCDRWTTRRWFARVTSVSPGPSGWLARLSFSHEDRAPRLSHHVLREDGRTVSYRFDRSWHNDPGRVSTD